MATRTPQGDLTRSCLLTALLPHLRRPKSIFKDVESTLGQYPGQTIRGRLLIQVIDK